MLAKVLKQPGQEQQRLSALQVKSCCNIKPLCRINAQGVLGIFCPSCKRFEIARDGEGLLEIINRFNGI